MSFYIFSDVLHCQGRISKAYVPPTLMCTTHISTALLLRVGRMRLEANENAKIIHIASYESISMFFRSRIRDRQNHMKRMREECVCA